VDRLRFAISSSSSTEIDQAGLGKRSTHKLSNGVGPALFQEQPATKHWIAVTEVLLGDGHKGTCSATIKLLG
jgi:hypothetical protein